MPVPDAATVRDALAQVYDPCCAEKGLSVVDLGLVRRTEITEHGVHVELLLTSGWCPFAARVLEEVERRVAELPGVPRATVEVVWSEAWTTDRLSDRARRALTLLPSPKAAGDRDRYLAQLPRSAGPDQEAAR